MLVDGLHDFTMLRWTTRKHPKVVREILSDDEKYEEVPLQIQYDDTQSTTGAKLEYKWGEIYQIFRNEDYQLVILKDILIY